MFIINFKNKFRKYFFIIISLLYPVHTIESYLSNTYQKDIIKESFLDTVNGRLCKQSICEILDVPLNIEKIFLNFTKDSFI